MITLTALPDDELSHLFSLCSLKSLLRLAQVNHYFHDAIDSNETLIRRIRAIGPVRAPNRPGCASVLRTISKHLQASTFEGGAQPGFELSRNGRCAARVYPIGYRRIRGKVALPRGCAFTVRLCPLDGFHDVMYLMQVGVEWHGAQTVWGPARIDDVSICTDPRTPLIGTQAARAVQSGYGPAQWKIGDVVRVFFAANGDVRFAVNGKDYGVAFAQLPAREVWPFASLYLPNSIEFVGEAEYLEDAAKL